ncbi:MAG: TerC family protein [Chloroflexota bacterium]
MEVSSLIPWVGFLAIVGVMLAVDLGFNREAHVVSRKESLAWTAVWVSVALLFCGGVFLRMGNDAGLQWFTGYVVEKSLAIDNVFVFLLIFSAFAVPQVYQHRLLFWGIIGALVLRAILIAFAGVLITRFHWSIYVFGAFLIITGIKFLRDKEEVPSLEDNRLVRFARKLFPVTDTYHEDKFFIMKDGIRWMTPLCLVMVLIGASDLVFAVDSIPAIYAITDDPFIVFTSNVMAVLGLRAMFFLISGFLYGLHYLKPGLAAVLAFVGLKMVLVDVYKVPALVSLGVIVSILAVAIVASLVHNRREEAVANAPQHA